MVTKTFKPPNINDVAAAAGVSKKTVSRVINQSTLVTGETQARVHKAIEELRYVPNLQARSMTGQRSFLLGFVYDNPNAEYVSELQSGVLTVCQRGGYELLVRQCRSADPDLAANLASLAERTKLDGVIILPPLSERDDLADSLAKVGCSYVRIGSVALDRRGNQINCKDRHAAEQMAVHLVERGHRNIGFIRGPRGYKSAAERAQGFRDGLKKSGLPLEKRLTALGAYTYESGLSCGRRLLELKEPPSAIFASNDQMASGVLHAAYDLGLSVPDDIAIAGFDDGPVAERAWPPLTTIRQPVRKIGEYAAMKLIHAGNDINSTPDEVEPELVIRASTAAP